MIKLKSLIREVGESQVEDEFQRYQAALQTAKLLRSRAKNPEEAHKYDHFITVLTNELKVVELKRMNNFNPKFDNSSELNKNMSNL
jgi:hypothetical protein